MNARYNMVDLIMLCALGVYPGACPTKAGSNNRLPFHEKLNRKHPTLRGEYYALRVQWFMISVLEVIECYYESSDLVLKDLQAALTNTSGDAEAIREEYTSGLTLLRLSALVLVTVSRIGHNRSCGRRCRWSRDRWRH